MPQATMKEESEYPVPAGVPLPAVLQEVKVRTIEFFKKDQYGNKTNVKDSFDKWVWEFKITDGEFAGMKVYGETSDSLTTREDNLVRIWAEQLLGKTIQVGEGLDTDLLLGLPCIVECRHDEPRPKRDGGMFYPCPVSDVFPSSGDYVSSDPATTSTGWSDEPSF